MSHNGNKNILVMVDQLTSWPIATAIPDKEATTVANAIHKDLILQHGVTRKSFCLTMARNFAMILWPMSVKNMALHNISQVLRHLDPMARQKTLISS